MADDRNDRGKAIDVALAQIDKQFGKGSCMRLGSRTAVDVPAIPTGALSLDAASAWGACPEAGSWRSSARNRPARPRSLSTSSPKPRRPAAWRHSWTPSTPWTRATPPSWV